MSKPPFDLPSEVSGFPWPEVRDFISAMISFGLARQNLIVGEQMVEREADPERKKVIEESLPKVRDNVIELQNAVNVANAKVEKALSSRLILPH